MANRPVATKNPSPNPRIGAHVSTAGHIDIAADHADGIEAEAVQIFGAAPQQWRRKEHAPEHIAAFREKMGAAGVGPNYIHGIYLTNLGTPNPPHLRQGVESLTADMRLGSALAVSGVIFHVGSHLGAGFDAVLPQIVTSIKEVLAESPDDICLCIENNAGTGNSVGSSFGEIGAIMSGVGSSRVKVCLDTCHAYSANYDLLTADGLAVTMAEFDREIGLDNLVAVHANDSKTPRGSGKDRHENIGWGSIGIDGFRNLIGHPTFQRATWLLEVPGFEGGGPDRLNVRILRALRDGTALPRIPKPKAPDKKPAARKPVAEKPRARKSAAKKSGATKRARKASSETKQSTRGARAVRSKAAKNAPARKRGPTR
jgi:deoxyribonuclease-4